MFGKQSLKVVILVHNPLCRLKFSLPLSQLPLETRVCFTIHGNESLTRKPIGWVAMPIFDLNKYALCYNLCSQIPPLSLDVYKLESITCVCGLPQRGLIPLAHVMVTH